MKAVLNHVKDQHKGFGEPPYRLEFIDEPSCSSCAHAFEDGDNAFLGRRVAGLYCKDCGVPESRKPVDGERKVASHVKIVVKSFADEGSVRQEIRDDYLENDLDLPDEEQLDKLVEKRLESSGRDRDEFLSEASALSVFAN